jgi:hypothetical protein
MEKNTIYEMLGFVIAFLGLGIAYIAIISGMRQERRKRELEHKERMQALELGRNLPGDSPWLSPLRAGVLIATIVPIGVFGVAFLTTRAIDFRPDIWQSAGLVSVFALACGSVVSCLAFLKRPYSETQDAGQIGKVTVGEDMFDVVSSRG